MRQGMVRRFSPPPPVRNRLAGVAGSAMGVMGTAQHNGATQYGRFGPFWRQLDDFLARPIG
jgi:hypothetical protein